VDTEPLPVDVRTAAEVLLRDVPVAVGFIGTKGVVLDVGRFEALSSDLRDSLAVVAGHLIASGFGQDPNGPAFAADVRGFLSGGHLFLVMVGGEPALLRNHGSFDTRHGRVLLLMGVVVAAQRHDEGLATVMHRAVIRKVSPRFLATRTQNPLVYDIVRRYVSQLYPNASDPEGEVPREIREVADLAAAQLGCRDFQREIFVDRGTYGEPTHSPAMSQKSRDPAVNQFFGRVLDVARGDSVLLLGEV
jgi:hypothetical protein